MNHDYSRASCWGAGEHGVHCQNKPLYNVKGDPSGMGWRFACHDHLADTVQIILGSITPRGGGKAIQEDIRVSRIPRS